MNTSVDDVWQMIKEGRGTQTDWFSEQVPPETLAETLTAMANSQGGTLILGVTSIGKAIVIAQIPAGMPHVYCVDGRYLHRQGHENSPLKARELRRLIIERGEASL